MEHNTPKMYTLSGKALAAYRAGTFAGASTAFKETSKYLKELHEAQARELKALAAALADGNGFDPKLLEEIPSLADGLLRAAHQMDQSCNANQVHASQQMGKIAGFEDRQEASRSTLKRWSVLGFGMFVLAVTVATAISTLLASYL